MKGLTGNGEKIARKKYPRYESQKAYERWYHPHLTDYLEYIKRRGCLCCGKSPTELDHIVADKKAFKGGDSRMFAIKKGNIQLLCRSCQLSKADGWECHKHNKYLGVWNYLPELYDMEGGMN